MRPARQVAELRSAGGDRPPEDRQGLVLILADGTEHPYPGTVVAYDAAINPTTGTFTIEADFPNPGGIVLAGQFARVRAVAEYRDGAVLVPQRAVTELQGIFRVFVIDDDNTAKLRTVELGPSIGNLRIVESGVEAGERVAIEGLLRLTNDAPVDPTLTTLDALAPKPGSGD